MNAIYSLVLETLRGEGLNLPFYESLLGNACAESAPPYGERWYGDQYRNLATDPLWLAGSLLANAVKEADGAAQLKLLVAKTPLSDFKSSKAVRVHMQDEATHAKFFLRLLETAFPNIEVEEPLMESVDRLIPDTKTFDEHINYPLMSFLDELCQINIGEIRTKVHQLLLQPMILEHAKLGKTDRTVGKMMSRLIADEGRHITYTAKIIEKYSQDPDLRIRLQKLFVKRFDIFNTITIGEIGQGEAAL